MSKSSKKTLTILEALRKFRRKVEKTIEKCFWEERDVPLSLVRDWRASLRQLEIDFSPEANASQPAAKTASKD